MDDRIPGYKKVSIRFKQYDRSMKDIWASYCFIQDVTDDYLERLRKNENSFNFKLESLSGTGRQNYQKPRNNCFGIVDHIQKVVNIERSFIAAVAQTEDFLKDIAIIVYTDYPQKVVGLDYVENEDKQNSLLKKILTYDTKQEVLESIIEERVRSIFYGNSINYFVKDKKMNLGFKDFFEKNHAINLKIFAEIIARRNLYAHNSGRVDSKYLREVENPKFQFGRKAVLEKEYLRQTIITLRGLSSIGGHLINENIYNRPQENGGVMEKIFTTFNKYYDDSNPLETRCFNGI